MNAGYQRDDREIVDYQLWQLGDQQARGPRVPVDQPFGVVIGAAQVFGRFVQRPFPAQLADSLQLPMLNLGFSGSGPSFFLQRPELLDIANKARLVVVHLMSGRSVSNSKVIVDKNQGVAFLRDEPDRPALYAEDAYKELIRTMPVAELASLRAEIRFNYVAEMRALLDRIAVPKVLLYWARRPVDYAESLRGIAGYWGDFPHFVNREVVDQLRTSADRFVEVVSDRGLPQPLYDRATGDPVEIWPADRFPNVQLRDHNYYYPSPEMNEDAARALLPSCLDLIEETARNGPTPPAERRPVRRQLLAHPDIFCNAGSAVTRSLRDSFGQRFVDGSAVGESGPAILAALREDDGIQALSTARWRFELAGALDADVHTLVFLQHPLLRAKAMYAFERSETRQRESDSFHTRVAGSSSLAEWIEWCLTEPIRAAPISNYQTRICGRTASGLHEEDWSRRVTLACFEEATINLADAYVGTVEQLAGAMTRIEVALRPAFPTLRLKAHGAEEYRASAVELRTATTDLCEEIGETLFAHLASANAYDLLLHDHASAPVARGRAAA